MNKKPHKNEGMRIELMSRATQLPLALAPEQAPRTSLPHIFRPAQMPLWLIAGTKWWACHQRSQTSSRTRFWPRSSSPMRFLRLQKLKLERYLSRLDTALLEGIDGCDSCLSYWDPPCANHHWLNRYSLSEAKKWLKNKILLKIS